MADTSRPEPPAAHGRLSLSRTAVLRDGRPWFPVMGEHHFARARREDWGRELRKMRAGGVGVVATYVIWVLHEERRGKRRFDGHRDVRAFVEESAAAGLEVVLRIGPWAHGEARNGGFPDWLQQLPVAHRTDDPAYLEVVDDWYAAIGRELRGLFRTEACPGAPIIAVQVDNELYDQPGHLATLRDLAESHGIEAPLWLATGWGGAQLPLERVAPVYAGYPEAFWEDDVDWPPFSEMHFRYSTVRDDLSVGADVRAGTGPEPDAAGAVEDTRHPFLTCELGGGMATAYHRRPHVDPDDVAALALTKIGSGSAWQGYYLYHGSTQVTGELGGTQESHETGYPNDMPRKDYDFFAPLGAAGAPREHHHLLRRQHLLLAGWGGQIASLPVHLPEAGHPLRHAVRAEGGRGFAFVTNHQPAAATLPPVPATGVVAELGDRRVRLPADPTGIPSGCYAVWPLRQALGDVDALSGTVQLLTRVDDATGPVVLLSETPGVPVELLLETDLPVRGAREVATGDGPRWVPDAPPGPDCVLTVGTTRLVVLDDATARRVWRVEVAGRPTALVWDGALLEDDGVVLERWTAAARVLSVPAVPGAAAGPGVLATTELPAWEPRTPVPTTLVRRAAGAAPVRRGGSADRLSAPRDEDFAAAAVVEVALDLPDGDAALVLEVTWRGDVARAEVGGVLVADQFWSGRTWEVDLSPWREQLRSEPLVLRVLPLGEGPRPWVDARWRHAFVPGAASVEAAVLVVAPRIRLAPSSAGPASR